MSRGDSQHAAQHLHGVQTRETGKSGSPVTEERVAALEKQVAELTVIVEELKARAEASV